MKRLFLSAAAILLTACGTLQPGSSVTTHDLGGLFLPGERTPLRGVQLAAQPLVATTAMQYRDASQPTRRAAYALNRWAATPAAMLEPALNRLLSPSGQGNCRLMISLSEFIIEVDAKGASRAVIAADLRLITGERDAPVLGTLDVSTPLARTAPAEGAQAMRSATGLLASEIRKWLMLDAARACKA